MDPNDYFATQSPPEGLENVEAQVSQFIETHRNTRRIVLVTSGGTTVPLEKETVRFIDNFSAGTRGAASAEYFLDAGYAVVFLHRQFSLQPYSRNYTHSTNCFLDFLDLSDTGSITVKAPYAKDMTHVLLKYQQANRDKTLLMLHFVSVRDYLFTLRSLTRLLAPLGNGAMYYLAAAVSDFFIPPNKMAEHKIQSSGGGISIQLDPVPKIIRPLVKEWSPHSFVVSFKLETDPSLLMPKGRGALDRYGHQVVIGNILATRKQTVTFITPQDQWVLSLTPEQQQAHVEIESLIIPTLVRLHDAWISTDQATL